MEKRSKATQKKTDARPKKTDKSEKPDTTTTDNHNVEVKLQLWKQNSKELKQFEFLNLQLYSEYLTLQRTNTANTSQTDGSPKLKNAVKYLSLIKYIDQHSDPNELDAVLHNIAFMYEIDKETLKTEALAKKKSIKKSPKSMSISQYLNSLIEVDMKKAGLAKSGELEVFLLPVKTDGEGAKEVVSVENDEVVEEKKGKSRGTKKSKLEEATQRQAEVNYPTRKRVKGNNTSAAAEGNSEGMPVVKQEEEKENPKEVKEKASKGKKQTKPKKKDDEDSDDEDDPLANMPEQYMEIKINNPIDDDDGDSFSFFYVNENIYNKTKHYFEKKLDPEEVCSCPGACNDPLICPCARANFENSGKTSCYVYDSKYGKKRLLHQLIKRDQHIYECSANCACAKSMCLNSCVNEDNRNRFDVNNFIVERIKKEYKGDDPKFKDLSATMWGLRTKVFIPTNTYVVEYCGEIITKKEGDKRGEKYDAINCNYLFDLNKHAEIEKVENSSNTVYMNVDGVCEARSTNKLKDLRENFPLVIDAFFYGNHSRFVNHSCSPNMVALAVHIENRDILLPRIIYFALRDIQPGEELTIDYNCAPLKDLKNTELLVCLCGAEVCRGYVYEEAEDSDVE